MEPINFVYWLQGFLEIANPTELNETQIKIIKDHVALVLYKQTPDRTSQVTQMERTCSQPPLAQSDLTQHTMPALGQLFQTFESGLSGLKGAIMDSKGQVIAC